MENHISSISSFIAFQDNVWKTFEYRTIKYDDGSTVLRVRGYSDTVQLYDEDGQLTRDAKLGKQIDALA